MLKSARNNPHSASACAKCRKSKTKCDGKQPVCGSCKSKGKECTWTFDSDRRTARGRKCLDCETWRTTCADLEARLAVAEARFQQRPDSAGLSSIHSGPELGSPALQTAQDSFATDNRGAQQPLTALEGEERLFFQEPLFPLHEGFPEFHPEAIMPDHCIDETYWLPGATTEPLPEPTTELNALYGCPFAAAERSSFHTMVPDGYVAVKTVEGDVQK